MKGGATKAATDVTLTTFPHQREDGVHDPERAEHVRLEDASELVDGQLLDR